MEVVVATFKPAPYSIKHIETYQVALSYPVFPPSTLIGAIAYSLSQLGLCSNPDECIARARSMVSRVRDSAISGTWFGVILRRSRKILQDRILPSSPRDLVKTKKDRERAPKHFSRYFELQQAVSDAMVRDYVFSYEHRVLVIPRSSSFVDTLSKAIWLISRVGDSESLVSVSDIEVVKAERCDGGKVNVSIIDRAGLISGGTYTVVRAKDEHDNTVSLAIPVYRRGSLYISGEIYIDRDVMCAEELRFPSGGEW